MPQTQTPNIFAKPGRMRDYSPAADVYAGDVVVIGTQVYLSPVDIGYSATTGLGAQGTPLRGSLHADGLWRLNKDSSTFADGAPVYWNPTGTPVVGTAGTGAASSTAAGGYYVGKAVVEDGTSVLTGDQYVGVLAEARAPRLPVATVAAAGSTQGNAAQVYEGFNVVTGPDDTKGVVLPTAVAGMVVYIKVGDGADLKVYPATGAAINALSANAAITVVDDVCFALVATSATQWYTLPLLPS